MNEGAERERRRIRRVQAGALRDLDRLAPALRAAEDPGISGSVIVIRQALDAATRARKGRKC
jgi:hypothetical protein